MSAHRDGCTWRWGRSEWGVKGDGCTQIWGHTDMGAYRNVNTQRQGHTEMGAHKIQGHIKRTPLLSIKLLFKYFE